MTIMLQAYRFALDPTPAQEAALRSHCGGQRYAFNWGLRLVTAVMDQRRAEASYGIPTDELTPSLSWSGWAIPGRLLTAPAQLSAFHLPVWQLLVIMAVVATVIA
ncbi:MAG TPA: helix-turn-helix domain-containing protein [Pseudonocardiaceae bacterium]